MIAERAHQRAVKAEEQQLAELECYLDDGTFLETDLPSLRDDVIEPYRIRFDPAPGNPSTSRIWLDSVLPLIPCRNQRSRLCNLRSPGAGHF